jgi:hypothetical protein
MRGNARAAAVSHWLERHGWWIGSALLLAVVLWMEETTPLSVLASLAVFVLLSWRLAARTTRGFREGWQSPE